MNYFYLSLFGMGQSLSYLSTIVKHKTNKMKLKEHPKQGDTYKGYTIKGFNKTVSKRRGYTLYFLYLENDKGVRRIAQYKPKRKDVYQFEKHQENGHADYYVEWLDCNLNRVTYNR